MEKAKQDQLEALLKEYAKEFVEETADEYGIVSGDTISYEAMDEWIANLDIVDIIQEAMKQALAEIKVKVL